MADAGEKLSRKEKEDIRLCWNEFERMCVCHLAPVKTSPSQRPLGAGVPFFRQDPCLLIQLVTVRGVRDGA